MSTNTLKRPSERYTSSSDTQSTAQSDLGLARSQASEEPEFWPSDFDLEQSLSSDSASDEPLPGGEDGQEFSRRTVLEKLICRWAEIAVSHAIVRRIDDPDGWIATVAGVDGAWGFGRCEKEALDELGSVLVGWASLKMEDGDDDIPSMEGLHLVVDG